MRMMQQSLRTAPSTKKRAKSVYSQRNLGTIKERKKEKQQETEVTSEQTIMRILRMRYVLLLCYKDLMVNYLRFSPRTSEFIAQQLRIMSAMQAEQEQRMKEFDERKQKRQQQYQQQQQIPSVPPPPVL